MLLWSTLYLLYALCQGWRPAGAGAVVLRLTTEPIHLRYFWAIAALYLFTPVLSAFAANANRRLLLCAVALTGLFGFPRHASAASRPVPPAVADHGAEQAALCDGVSPLLSAGPLSEPVHTNTHTCANGGQSASPRRRFCAGAARCGCPKSRVIGAGLC